MAAQNYVIGINYRLLSDDLEKAEWKQAMWLEGIATERKVYYQIPLGFKIVGVLLRDGMHVQDLLLSRVFATREYRALCETEAKRQK